MINKYFGTARVVSLVISVPSAVQHSLVNSREGEYGQLQTIEVAGQNLNKCFYKRWAPTDDIGTGAWEFMVRNLS